ncbi:High-affinity branched-chain amino acid transport ATP-binding protein LivF [Roseovarius litorisediminis]|uniref:High-affinity branched-chain amino acid transport ATP-binding protein LivF n=1 Tax=Roseovarius litorisediminis TaxID=1312363 RepID=A0A1Y5RMS1_9RHOB|nr:ABC transporter ATP-binding protein [Roseovarius litorisediminis]SLN21155.1 High-affinity branched-chain amino acid transport ATP-binding protein LivF [Roseovarius litorisediminis]
MMLLSTRGLSKHFDGLQAVQDVDFDLPIGQVRALIGPNGAGKTTLVGMICGRIEPSEGRVFFDEVDITALPAHKRIMLGMAYTFQITSVFSRLPAAENVALAARRRLHGDKVDTAVKEALDQVGLLERMDQEAGDLSYGHQRLLEIAMGLVQKPRLLILDEPTQGLADSEITDFKNLIRELAGDTTILLIEHNMNVVMETADQVTVLNFGEVLAEGTPDEIHANAAVQAAYLGTG